MSLLNWGIYTGSYLKMIKAIIFDWGGVLIEYTVPRLIAYCAKYLKISDEEFPKVLLRCRPDFQNGIISEDLFWGEICSELGISKPGVKSLWGEAFRAVYTERREVFSLASSLKEHGYKIGLLSNTEIPAVNYFYELGYKLFDVTIFSCIERVSKPEKRIYEVTLNRLGVQPKEAIFIDDKKDNIKGAEEVWINAILFKSIGQLKKELVTFSILID